MTLSFDTTLQEGVKTFDTQSIVRIFFNETTAYPTGGWPLADIDMWEAEENNDFDFEVLQSLLGATTPASPLIPVVFITPVTGTKFLRLYQASDGAEVGNGTDVVLVAGQNHLAVARW